MTTHNDPERQVNLSETIVPDGGVTLFFECGCRVSYFTANGHVLGGLACCAEHEAPYQKLENILPLTIVKIRHE